MMYDIVVFESNLRFRPSTRKKYKSQRFRKTPFWEPVSKTYIFGARKRYIRMDGSLQSKLSSFSKISGYV